MSIRIEHDAKAPNAAIELTIRHPLPDYDLEEIEHRFRATWTRCWPPKDSTICWTRRAAFWGARSADGLEVVQLTGAICSEGRVHRPGLWLVLRETGAPAGEPMSAEAKAQVTAVAEELRGGCS